jgi:hypothetical protein
MAMSKKLVPHGSHYCVADLQPLDRMIIVLQNNGVFVNYIPRQTHWVCARIVMKMRNFAKVHPIWQKLPKNVFARKLFLAKTIRDIIVKIVQLSLFLQTFCRILSYYVTILIFAKK